MLTNCCVTRERLVIEREIDDLVPFLRGPLEGFVAIRATGQIIHQISSVWRAHDLTQLHSNTQLRLDCTYKVNRSSSQAC